MHVQQDIECIVEHLTESLRRFESAPITTLEGEWHFTAQIKMALGKAEEYYDKLDDSAAYLAAIVLNPKYKWDYIESQWATQKDWLKKGKHAVAGLWAAYAKQPILEAISSPRKPTKSNHEPSKMELYRTKGLQKAKGHPASRAVQDEYSLYCHQLPIDSCDNPLQWWRTTGFEMYPHLTKMAIDLLSIPAMSDEPERVFSRLGLMITKRRNHLHYDTIQASQCLYSWDSAEIINLRAPPVTV